MVAATIGVGLGWAFFSAPVFDRMPAHARLIVDDQTKVYLTPKCWRDGEHPPDLTYANRREIRAAELASLGPSYEPYWQCGGGEFFTTMHVPGWRYWLLREKPLPRWNPDGTWNY